MNRYDVEQLATYNSEVSRGIVHTKEYNQKMKDMQEQFDKEYTNNS